MKRKEVTAVKLFDLENVSIAGFCNFCKNNLPLIIAVTFALFFTYGAKLFWYNIGIDTEAVLVNREGVFRFCVGIGRFGLVFLSNIWNFNEFNPFTGFFVGFCLIWFFAISWSYIIAIFDGNTGRNNKLIPFALVLMTMPVWAEQFYFVFQAAENALIVALCPYVIYFFYKGFLNNEKRLIVSAFVLLIFMTSVYQAIVPLFCGGVFAFFLLLQERSNYEPKVYRNLCIKFFAVLVAAMAVYSLIDRIVIPIAFGIEKADYFDNMNQWGRKPITTNIMAVLIWTYDVFVGHTTVLQRIVPPSVIAPFFRTGIQGAEIFLSPENTPVAVRTFLLLPLTVLFLVKAIEVMRKAIPNGRKFLYVLAGIGVPLSIILLTIMGGNPPVTRALYALPFAYAFMFFYLIRSHKKPFAAIIISFALIAALYQAQTTSRLFFSDHVRYNDDVRLANKLNDLIIQIQPEEKSLPVVLVGRYQTALRFPQRSFLQGETMGHSLFEWDFLFNGTAIRGLGFMSSLGFHFNRPSQEQIVQAREIAAFMPAYPKQGFMKRAQDFIVVKLSDDIWIDPKLSE
ncbi:MAG: glucosyltransferase domain-containing protein [Chitinivibrionia bacterium]|nr:glucosyltransferase domain-containing protein [Chitinivibrionia bacterium]